MNKKKNTIPFIHVDALSILSDERNFLAEDLREIKKQIAHLSHARWKEPDDYRYFTLEMTYGGTVSTLMKRKHGMRQRLKSIEASIKTLKIDAQEHHQAMWEQEQYIKEGPTGSYNCSYGC